jgi:hypothetical protein
MFRARRNRNEVNTLVFEKRRKLTTSDLVDVPSQLRQVLETCLARDASPRVLEIYLPKVREIVINLLQGLKRKQARYRARSTELESDSKSISQQSILPKEKDLPVEPEPRRRSPARRPVGARDVTPDRKKSRDSQPRDSSRSSSQQAIQAPVITTQPSSPTLETNEALQRLQTSDVLQRRASKRFSTYNLSKMDGLEGDGIGRNIPPVPPVPTRRSGGYSSEIGRNLNTDKTTPYRRSKSPERRPVEPTVPEEGTLRIFDIVDVDSRASLTEPTLESIASVSESQARETSPEKIPVFLQLGSSVRKTLVSVTELSLQSLRLLFVEKFQFNPGADAFPDILVTDRETGIPYILEEGVQDIVEGTMLTLDVPGISLFIVIDSSGLDP